MFIRINTCVQPTKFQYVYLIPSDYWNTHTYLCWGFTYYSSFLSLSDWFNLEWFQWKPIVKNWIMSFCYFTLGNTNLYLLGSDLQDNKRHFHIAYHPVGLTVSWRDVHLHWLCISECKGLWGLWTKTKTKISHGTASDCICDTVRFSHPYFRLDMAETKQKE